MPAKNFTKAVINEGRKEGGESPEIERHRCAGRNLTGGCIAVRIVADDAVRIAVNGGAFNDMCEQTVFVLGAYAAGDRAVFGERVLDLIADHAVAEFVVILRGSEVIVHFAECIRAVEVIRVDNGDRAAGSQLLCTPHGMRGAERLSRPSGAVSRPADCRAFDKRSPPA